MDRAIAGCVYRAFHNGILNMNIVDIRLLQYTIPYKSPFFIKQISLEQREGILIRLENDDGLVGYGEIAPLLGYSHENRKEAAYHLQQVRSMLLGDIPSDLYQMESWLNQELQIKSKPSSVRFGIEMALLNLLGASRHRSIVRLFDGCEEDVHVAGLLQGSVHDIENQMVNLRANQYRTFKLKVGNKNLPLDVKKWEVVHRMMDQHCLVRLDANQQWSVDEATMFFKNIDTNQIEYVEEPFADWDAIDDFVEQTGVSVALDESLSFTNIDRVLQSSSISHVVLKPSFNGGIFETISLIERAQKHDKKVVISSMFESGLALTALANLAVLTKQVSGLGTLNWFKHDLLQYALVSDQGVVHQWKLMFEENDIDQHLIHEFDW